MKRRLLMILIMFGLSLGLATIGAQDARAQDTDGDGVPVKFSLTGYQGLNIIVAGYPISSPIPCEASAPGDDIEETVNAGGSSLTYDATTDRCNYVWKTNKAWKGTCRILVVRLDDGTDHFAEFRFK